MQPAIRVEHLAKSYRILHEGGRAGYKTMRESISALASRALRRTPTGAIETTEEFWALKDVSFEVQPGEVIGIIGRNGAGKSTLLKILSRVTKPTKGRATLNGRVGSLLEVGTGFHPELTGRENIYLNGSILGMRRSEIDRHFAGIVGFAEIERFLDTPVKRYSSGMYVRLAFAVAAHLEPELLIIDEVLAVGDASFQRKCLGKLSDVAKQGRTVIFVSHQMNAIRSLCQKVLLLRDGQVSDFSRDVDSVVRAYLPAPSDKLRSFWENPGRKFANPWFRPTRFFIADADGKAVSHLMRNDQPLKVVIEGEAEEVDIALNVGYAIFDDNNDLLYWSTCTDGPESSWPNIVEGYNIVQSRLPRRLLNEGDYRLELLISLYHREWICQPGSNSPGIWITISGGLSDSPYWMERRPGVLGPVLDWTHSSSE